MRSAVTLENKMAYFGSQITQEAFILKHGKSPESLAIKKDREIAFNY